VTREDFRRKADLVREIPLEVVLTSWGAVRDRRDRSQWRTRRGPLSVTGTKFFHWHDCQGGGGAIDLVMLLGGWDAGQAVEWLWRHLGCRLTNANPTAHTGSDADTPSTTGSRSSSAFCSGRSGPPAVESDDDPARRRRHQQLRLPAASPANLQRVRGYLTRQRSLSADVLDPLIDDGRLYADARGNAVFLMVAGRPPRAIGAELRGTGSRVWRGLAPGSRKNAGYFWIGTAGPKQIVICESAIDAISCFQLHTQLHDAQLPVGACVCISTGGVRPDPPWLHPLLARGYDIYCGFDADQPGETAGRQMIALHPSIQRLRPPKHDWNDTLTSRHQ
jgi:Protein of unknown function (DUF3991)/Toprim-like